MLKHWFWINHPNNKQPMNQKGTIRNRKEKHFAFHTQISIVKYIIYTCGCFKRCSQPSSVCQCIHQHRTSIELQRWPMYWAMPHALVFVSMHRWWHPWWVWQCLHKSMKNERDGRSKIRGFFKLLLFCWQMWFSLPARMAGISPGFGGVNSARAYLAATCNCGRAAVKTSAKNQCSSLLLVTNKCIQCDSDENSLILNDIRSFLSINHMHIYTYVYIDSYVIYIWDHFEVIQYIPQIYGSDHYFFLLFECRCNSTYCWVNWPSFRFQAIWSIWKCLIDWINGFGQYWNFLLLWPKENNTNDVTAND